MPKIFAPSAVIISSAVSYAIFYAFDPNAGAGFHPN
jgi:hypothetical protein